MKKKNKDTNKNRLTIKTIQSFLTVFFAPHIFLIWPLERQRKMEHFKQKVFFLQI